MYFLRVSPRKPELGTELSSRERGRGSKIPDRYPGLACWVTTQSSTRNAVAGLRTFYDVQALGESPVVETHHTQAGWQGKAGCPRWRAPKQPNRRLSPWRGNLAQEEEELEGFFVLPLPAESWHGCKILRPEQ